MSIWREDEYLRKKDMGLSMASALKSREGVLGVEQNQFLKLGGGDPSYFGGCCMEDCLLRKAGLSFLGMREWWGCYENFLPLMG